MLFLVILIGLQFFCLAIDLSQHEMTKFLDIAPRKKCAKPLSMPYLYPGNLLLFGAQFFHLFEL